MHSRMNNPVMVIRDAMKALQALSSAVGKGGVPQSTLGLVELRASQINGCGVCVDMHARLLRQAGEVAEKPSRLKSALRGDIYVIDSPCSVGAHACGSRT